MLDSEHQATARASVLRGYPINVSDGKTCDYLISLSLVFLSLLDFAGRRTKQVTATTVTPKASVVGGNNRKSLPRSRFGLKCGAEVALSK